MRTVRNAEHGTSCRSGTPVGCSLCATALRTVTTVCAKGAAGGSGGTGTSTEINACIDVHPWRRTLGDQRPPPRPRPRPSARTGSSVFAFSTGRPDLQHLGDVPGPAGDRGSPTSQQAYLTGTSRPADCGHCSDYDSSTSSGAAASSSENWTVSDVASITATSACRRPKSPSWPTAWAVACRAK